MTKMMTAVVMLVLFAILGASIGPASAAETQERDLADALLSEGKFDEAAVAYEKFLVANEEDGYAWFRLGYARHRAAEYTRAAEVYGRADALGFAPILTKYNHACVLAQAGDGDAAWSSLEAALDAGYGDSANLEVDEELASLRERDGFADLVERAIKGCALIESWTSKRGGVGLSINFFDASIGKWRQEWVDESGGGIHYVGGLVDGEMVFEGENYSRDGTSARSRMTFTPNEDGTVRQFIEQSSDDGETWSPWFDGLYRPLGEVSRSR